MRACAAVVCVVVASLVATPGAARAGEPTYTPPVDAPVIDPFRAPTTAYGAGNRGIEYATTPGARIRAIGDGVVVFAGQVAGHRHVTIEHADGLRSSYSFLASIVVAKGARVARGAVVGDASERFHLGVRRGEAYLDPAGLFTGQVRVRLVPEGADDGAAPSEAAMLAAIVRDRGAGTGALAWLGDRAGDVGSALRALDPRDSPLLRAASIVRDTLVAAVSPRRRCAPAGSNPPVPEHRRVAVLVGGLGSTSVDAAIDDLDATSLGYAEGDVIRFSYAGGRTPDPTDAVGADSSAYTAADTQQDLRVSAARLADLLLSITQRAPGAPVDLLAHSQGGVVARLAVEALARRGALPDAIDLLVTFGAPHQGAPLATLATLDGSPQVDALEALGEAVVGLDADLPSPAQLAPGSPALSTSPMPAGVRVLALAARTDPVVPAPSARLAGAVNVVVAVDGPAAHDTLPGSGEAAREVALALAGLPPGCESTLDRMLDTASGGLLQLAEELLAGTAVALAG